MKKNKSRNTTILSLMLIMIAFAVRMMFMDGEGFNELQEESLPLSAQDFEVGFVEYVIDGDTAVVNIQGEEFKVRFIGVNTPEKGEPLYEESSEFTRNLIEGLDVILEKDTSNKDQYGRLLRYVWLDMPDENTESQRQQKMLNAILIKEQVAEVVIYKPNVKYEAYFRKLEEALKD